MKKDSRVRLINHNTPQGIGASFWDGVDNASGDMVTMLPGDNENDPWEILRYIKLLEQVDMIIPFVFNKRCVPYSEMRFHLFTGLLLIQLLWSILIIQTVQSFTASQF